MEILISAAIFIIVFASSIFFIKQTLLSVSRSLKDTFANYILQAKLEETNAIPFEDLISMPERPFDGEKGLIKIKAVAPYLAEIEAAYSSNDRTLKVSTFRSRF